MRLGLLSYRYERFRSGKASQSNEVRTAEAIKHPQLCFWFV